MGRGVIHSEINHTPAYPASGAEAPDWHLPLGFDPLDSLCVTEYVAVSGDEPADFARNWVIAVPLRVSNVPAIDVHARSGFEGDIVDTMYTAMTENSHMSFLVDPLANLLNPGYSGVGTVVCSTKECLSFFAFIDPDQGPSEVVVYGGSLARVPDSTNDGVCFVLWHLEKIHREPVFPRRERFSRDGPRRAYQSLKGRFEVQKDFRF